jgi:hypothetical protein
VLTLVGEIIPNIFSRLRASNRHRSQFKGSKPGQTERQTLRKPKDEKTKTQTSAKDDGLTPAQTRTHTDLQEPSKSKHPTCHSNVRQAVVNAHSIFNDYFSLKVR